MPDEGNAFKTGGLNPVRLDLPADIYRSSYWAGLGFLFLVIAWPAPFMLANTAIWLGWGKGAAVVVAIAAFVAGIAAWLGWQFRLKPRLQAR